MDKTIILQKKKKGKQQSFFYEGGIAKKGKYTLIKKGGTLLMDKNTHEVFSKIETTEKYHKKYLENDKKFLQSVSPLGQISVIEISGFKTIGSGDENVLSDEVFTYDEGIKQLEDYYKEDIFNLNK